MFGLAGRGLAVGTLGVLLTAVLWVLNCSGPQPVVSDVQLLEPVDERGPYRVQALVHNSGPGHGQVQVTFGLRDRRTGWTVVRDEKATLEPHETELVVTEIQAPRGDYEPRVEAQYPPR